MGAHSSTWLHQARRRVTWEAQRGVRGFTRRFGLLGGLLPLCGAIAAVAWIVDQRQASALVGARSHLEEKRQVAQPMASNGYGRARLKAFEDYLPAHDEIPTVVQDLLRLAGDEHLAIVRGEYKAQVDVQGGFLRYRMLLPVKGDAMAIHRFMQAALRERKTLALESVQFKRERIESSEVEARIQWVVLTRLPANRGSVVAVAGAVTGGGR